MLLQLHHFSNGSNRRRLMRFSIQYSTIGGLPNTFRLWLSLFLLPVALLWYDYALTWNREVQYFWKKRFTLSTVLYILCRYGMVANILYTLALANKLPTMRVSVYTVKRREVTEHNLFMSQRSIGLSPVYSWRWLNNCIFYLQLRCRVSNLRNIECFGSNRNCQWVGLWVV